MAKWTIDKNHSEITFRVKHLVISTVTGSFRDFEGTVIAEKEDFSDADIQFSASIVSVDTGNNQRDSHLQSADFFDAANYPRLEFRSTSISPIGSREMEIKGALSIRGISKPVSLKAEFGGLQKDFHGNTVAGFEITGKIKRKDFGLQWDAVTESGGIVLSDDVRLSLNVELIREILVHA